MDNISSEHQSAYTKNEPPGRVGRRVGGGGPLPPCVFRAIFPFGDFSKHESSHTKGSNELLLEKDADA